MSDAGMLQNTAEVTAAIGVIVTALASVWKFVVKPTRDWIRRTTKLWEQIASEFKPNGGSSTKDALNRIETRQIIESQKSRALTNDTIYGIWESDEVGKYVYVNRTFQRITGMTRDDLLGWGWVNACDPDDRQRLTGEWSESIKQEREWYGVYRVNRPDNGVQLDVVSVGHPLKGPDGKLKGYIGQLVVKSQTEDVFFSLDKEGDSNDEND